MRPGRHKHRERATGYPRGTAHTVGSGGSAIGSTRRPVSIGNGGHGQAAPCSSVATTTRPAWVLSWAREDSARWAGL
jgi:hypothetical protein